MQHRREDFHFFWTTKLSQWAMVPMVIDGITYNCCEQYMMARKALLFGDGRAYDAIMVASDPAVQKQIGRQVVDFNEALWKQHREEIVYRANLAKFTQHPELAELLLSTGDKIIVEASPEDTIWGIGLRSSHPDAIHPEKWRGLNLLGKALMRVREELKRRQHDGD